MTTPTPAQRELAQEVINQRRRFEAQGFFHYPTDEEMDALAAVAEYALAVLAREENADGDSM